MKIITSDVSHIVALIRDVADRLERGDVQFVDSSLAAQVHQHNDGKAYHYTYTGYDTLTVKFFNPQRAGKP